MPYLSLRDRAAIVTGAARGIERAIVERLVEEGAKVVAVDILAAELMELADRFPNAVVACVADVSIEADCQRYIRSALDHFGSVNLFVNNAGIIGQRRRLVDLAVSDQPERRLPRPAKRHSTNAGSRNWGSNRQRRIDRSFTSSPALERLRNNETCRRRPIEGCGD